MGVGIIYLQKTIKNHSYLYHTWILWVFVLLGSDVTEVPSSLKEFFITWVTCLGCVLPWIRFVELLWL